jgi:voltage-gated potassium channel
MAKTMSVRHTGYWLMSLWPRVPLALFMLLSGALNVLTGLRAQALLHVLPGLGQLSAGSFSAQTSLAALGSGAQAVLGAGLIVVGFGLLWRYRIAWTFALLLLLITIAVNLAKGFHGASLIVPGIVLLALLFSQRYFAKHTVIGSTVVSLISILIVLAYGTFGAFLLGDEFDPIIDNLVTALYFTIITLSTIGYGDIHPATETAQLFDISLVVVGLGVFATAVVSIIGPSLSNQLNRIFIPSGGTVKPKDHVILVGEGAIAKNTAQELEQRRIPLVQVVADGSEPPLPEAPVIYGDSSDDAVLKEAGIATAKLVIAAAEDDGENAFISLAAKDLNPNVEVLAIASSPRAIRRLKLARADAVFASAAVGSRLLANLVEGKQIPAEFLDLLKRGEA